MGYGRQKVIRKVQPTTHIWYRLDIFQDVDTEPHGKDEVGKSFCYARELTQVPWKLLRGAIEGQYGWKMS